MELVELSKEEYIKFTDVSLNHFVRSYAWGELSKSRKFIPHFVGLKDKNKLLCTALLLEKKLYGKYKYYYVPRGYTIDYSNKELLEKFTIKLKEYAKKNNAIFIKIDPDIKRYDLDLDGNILSSENELTSTLLNLGYKHMGYNLDFSGEQPRFTFRLKLDKDFSKIASNFHATTRKIYNKHNEYDLDIKIGSVDDIKDFYTTMEETAIRENFICYPLSYYENFYKTLNKYNMVDLYVVKLKVNKLIDIYNSKIDELKNKKENLLNNANSKTENKVKEVENELNKLYKDLEYANNYVDKEFVLSSIMTVKYQGSVWTLHGGNSNLFKHLNSNYLIYFKIIEDACINGYERIDFFGTCGIANPDKSNPIYGIHNFKKRLGGEYTEFVGEFDLITNKLMYTVFKLLIPIRRKIVNMKLKRGRK